MPPAHSDAPLWAAAPGQATASAETPSGNAVTAVAALAAVTTWELDLEHEALELLRAESADVWDVLTRRFESRLIQAALQTTRGRRVDAANKLGIGRNTITRKIQELGLE